MIRVLAMVIVLGGLARAQPTDPRLLEAQEHANRANELIGAGRYEDAAGVFVGAVKRVEAVRGADHPKVVELKITLANLYLTAGLYDRAEPLLRGALATMERLRGPDSEELLLSLASLGGLYTSMGAWERAEPLFVRALAIAEARMPNTVAVANLQASLGMLLMQRRDFDGAEARYRRGLKIVETQAPNGPELQSMLDGLGGVYQARGDHAHARPFIERVWKLRQAALGPDHPQVALAENNLAALELSVGQLDRAEALARRAIAVTARSLGTASPQYGNLVQTLTCVLAARGRMGEAVTLLTEAAVSSEQVLRNARLTSTEARMSSFLKLYSFHENTAYALWAAKPEEPAALALALTLALLRKGRIVDEAANLSRLVQQDLGPEEAKTFETLRGLRAELATRAFAGPGDTSRAAHEAHLLKLDAEAERLEQELALRSAPLKARAHLPSVKALVGRVAAALPQNAALVELVVFQPLDFRAKGGPSPGAARYAALVLLSGGEVRSADLGPATVIDDAVADLLDALSAPAPAFDLKPAQALDALVLAKLTPLLGGRTELVIAPDGQLNLVPFAVLHDGQRFAADRYGLTSVGSGRDLLRPSSRAAAGAIVVADPAFGAGGAVTTRAGGLLPATIPPLPGTRKEAAAIKKLLPAARVLLGGAATEPALLALKAPGILHVATHGVFLADLDPAEGTARAVKAGGPVQGPKNPLLRSALLLSGAGVIAPGGSDGLVTALELAGMNLWGTELVVLSACDTGRGDVKLGQGVYGLRRALQIAGAETVVTSLWRVDDDATRELMTRYYGALRKGAGRALGLREAAAAVRKVRPHPYYWAPFVVIGRGDPLKGTN